MRRRLMLTLLSLTLLVAGVSLGVALATDDSPGTIDLSSMPSEWDDLSCEEGQTLNGQPQSGCASFEVLPDGRCAVSFDPDATDEREWAAICPKGLVEQ